MNVEALAAEAVEQHGAQQKPYELATFGELLLDHGYTSIVEVGTLVGGTAWFLHALDLDVTVVDLNLTHAQRVKGVRYMQGDSARSAGRVGAVDVVFIDGDHTYAGVARDWDAYRPFVDNSGVIALHDIVEHPPEQQCDVSAFWAEVVCYGDLPTREIVDPDDASPWGGVGVAFL